MWGWVRGSSSFYHICRFPQIPRNFFSKVNFAPTPKSWNQSTNFSLQSLGTDSMPAKPKSSSSKIPAQPLPIWGFYILEDLGKSGPRLLLLPLPPLLPLRRRLSFFIKVLFLLRPLLRRRRYRWWRGRRRRRFLQVERPQLGRLVLAENKKMEIRLVLIHLSKFRNVGTIFKLFSLAFKVFLLAKLAMVSFCHWASSLGNYENIFLYVGEFLDTLRNNWRIPPPASPGAGKRIRSWITRRHWSPTDKNGSGGWVEGIKSVISPSLPKLSLSATPLAFPDLEAEAEVKK